MPTPGQETLSHQGSDRTNTKQGTTSEAQPDRLPVLDPVTDYEKIERAGEGTYGVVCRSRYKFFSYCTTHGDQQLLLSSD